MSKAKAGQWTTSRNGEHYTGAYDSEAEALAAWGTARPVYVAQIGRVETALDLLLHADADLVIEHANDQACDGWGTGDPVVDPDEVASTALTRMMELTLRQWALLYGIEGEAWTVDPDTVRKHEARLVRTDCGQVGRLVLVLDNDESTHNYVVDVGKSQFVHALAVEDVRPCWIRWRRTSRIPPGWTSWHYSEDGETAKCGHGPRSSDVDEMERREDQPSIGEMCSHCGWQGEQPAKPTVIRE